MNGYYPRYTGINKNAIHANFTRGDGRKNKTGYYYMFDEASLEWSADPVEARRGASFKRGFLIQVPSSG